MIALYRDGKPTDTKVGHKLSTLRASKIEKHGDHDQSAHGDWRRGDDSEGENDSEPKNYLSSNHSIPNKDDSEGEFGDGDYDNPKHMDTMDYPRKKKG